ncbi:pectinesterase [Fusarium oxysporum f. sp. raphani 54005]|uniref:pectinesterase n=1 Tax=Fusarium oxysporum f. sp. raphani 54005 TaxID=1089458 RepID=X0CCR6_FUSOX|nr:pectinesterase [Fusarium oxysporum f. sp. raphani 54005]
MALILKAVLVTSTLLQAAVADCFNRPAAPANTYKKCQAVTKHATEGCPPGTIYVAENDSQAHFNTIQAAIDSLANTTTPGHILIAPGNYTEQLNVTRQGPLHLIGMSNKPLNGDLYSDINVNSTAQNDVQVWWNSANHNAVFSDNVYTGVLTVGPTLNATLTGSGPTGFSVPVDTPFGCTDFRAYNIDFRNEFVPFADGPAHALGVGRANTGFYSCGFYSWQDTIYIGKLGNALFYDSVIAGQVDFLYGFGTAYIAKSTLSLRSCGGGVTAWKGTNTTFANKYGVYIDRTQVIASNYTIAQKIVGRCALGRPWNSQHRSIFMNSYFDASIKPAGYIPWGPTTPNLSNLTFMATWKDYGPGYNETVEAQSNVTLVLTDSDVAPYRCPANVFSTPDGTFGNIRWIDPSVW